jgi:hypothetical protein
MLEKGGRSIEGKVAFRETLLVAFASAPRHCDGRTRRLSVLPLLDRCAIKTPVAADAKSGEAALPQQTINCRRMDPQVF